MESEEGSVEGDWEQLYSSGMKDEGIVGVLADGKDASQGFVNAGRGYIAAMAISRPYYAMLSCANWF